MSRSKVQLQSTDTAVRPYRHDDEAQIVNLLNTCFGDWGTLQKWQFLYAQHPTFDKKDIVVLESNGEIIGHGGIHIRDLIIGKHKLSTATLSDAAIHPRHRGSGLYTKLVEARLKEADSRRACLVLTWHLRGSNAYEHNRKTGFIEIEQSLAYMKIIKPEKVLETGLFDLLQKNQRLRWVLEDIQNDLCFRIGETEFSISDLLGKPSDGLKKSQAKVKIIFDENSITAVASFRNMQKFERIRALVLLILLRRIKMKFVSLRVLLKVARKSIKIIGAI